MTANNVSNVFLPIAAKWLRSVLDVSPINLMMMATIIRTVITMQLL